MSKPGIHKRYKHSQLTAHPFNSPLTGSVFNDRKVHGVEEGRTYKYKPDEILSLVNRARLDEKAQAIINEACFIGIVTRETKPHYLRLASFSEVGYNEIKEILRLQKQELIKEYNKLLGSGMLATISADRYTMLYKAKYNSAPSATLMKNINHLKQNE